MAHFHRAICAGVLFIPFFYAKALSWQDEPLPNPVMLGIAPESPQHRCFEKPNGSKEAIHRLPQRARDWLAEDAIYLITPEERCEFLHLNSDEEREQFIEQYWNWRSVEPISLNYDFKTEFYRRIVGANEKYGSKLLAGRNTDRGRAYVIFGPPDSVDEDSRPADPHSIETWHYHYIRGIGENVEIHFEYLGVYDDYVFPEADRALVGQAEPNPEPFPLTPENMWWYYHSRTPQIRYKDLEALMTAQIVRKDVRFSDQVKYAAATHATTLTQIDVEIPCEACTGEGRVVEYPLFVRVSKASGWVVTTSELVADMAGQDKSEAKPVLTAHLDVPLAPGTYELAIATKNRTGEAGVVHTQIDVPTYEMLVTKN